MINNLSDNIINRSSDKSKPTYTAMKKLLNSQDGIILHDNILFYADQLNKKISKVVVSQDKQAHVSLYTILKPRLTIGSD